MKFEDKIKFMCGIALTFPITEKGQKEIAKLIKKEIKKNDKF